MVLVIAVWTAWLKHFLVPSVLNNPNSVKLLLFASVVRTKVLTVDCKLVVSRLGYPDKKVLKSVPLIFTAVCKSVSPTAGVVVPVPILNTVGAVWVGLGVHRRLNAIPFPWVVTKLPVLIFSSC